ncbi:MAG: membrane dipeptidase [Chlorobi bacterium]|nr:membrane dipeptidase [Chlorobiota bacterium]
MKKLLTIVAIFGIAAILSAQNKSEKNTMEKAKELAKKIIIVDTHIDVPYRLEEHFEDISKRTEKGNFDYVRAKEGGLDAPFTAIYTPAHFENEGGGKELADKLIKMMNKIANENPDKFKTAKSIDEIIQNHNNGIISFVYGMENGTPIEGKLENLRHFYDLGVRYVTLTHSKWNHIGDSSYDDDKHWNGLSPFGEELVKEMNRIGMMVDISHVSDSTFYDVLKITKAPVIASHSSCRFFTPGFERNMSDEMIKALAENGGVIQITFGSSFLSGKLKDLRKQRSQTVSKYVKENNLSGDAAKEYRKKYYAEHPVPYADVKDIADHIDHVVRLVGVDYVGIGSDFDGVGDSLPTGMKDVSDYPNLIAELLKRGYSEEEIEKIFSGNIFRVWREVEKISSELKSE